MPKTLLAVDDSATMRKVLEITFGGEDFRVVTAEGSSSALGRLGEEPLAAVIDATLGGDDGYALAKEIRARDAKIAVVVMASRNAPYDAARGKDAGVDDFIDKPFDTQAMIDKVKKALAARDAVKAAAPAMAMPAAMPSSLSPRPPGVAPMAQPAPSISAKPAFNPRTHTLSFEGGGPSPVAPSIGARPPPAAATLQPKPSPSPVAPPVRPASAVPVQPVTRVPAAPTADGGALASGSRFASRLGEMGLTPQQADAVLALSREVVERVVWEVVPQLAEVMIKEEIARLTKAG